VVIAGPNGAGKSTLAPVLLQEALAVTEFVNADVIARGLSAFAPEQVAMAAGRLMLARLRELAERRVSFAFESTLASRSFAPWIRQLLQAGYQFHLVFLWLPSAALAVRRVASRVRMGGHAVPADVVRRHAGLHNLFRIYLPLATTWRIYDSSRGRMPKLVAVGNEATTVVYDEALWARARRGANHGS